MKTKFALILFGLIWSFQGHSQKKNDRFIFTASSINYFPELPSYSFFSEIERDQDLLTLNFLTASSGTFVIEDVASTIIDIENINKFPTQIFNIGLSFQIRNANSVFHEFSISRFSQLKSSYVNIFSFVENSGNDRTIRIGYDQKSFILSLRYEFGKMFGKVKSKVRFGISGLVEPSFYSYKRNVQSMQEFPINANIYSFRVGMIPSLSFKLSKKVFLDLKLIPSFLIAEFGEVRVNNPSLSLSDRNGERAFKLPELEFSSTIQIRYLLKEPKKKRRRSKK